MIIKGNTLKYSENADNINTDVIWPGKYTYIQMTDDEMKQHAMETYDPNFKEKVKHCSVLVVGKNFGCGSSREQAVKSLKVSGIRAIIAKSFARIYYRNAINLGVAAIESSEIVDAVQNGDSIAIDLEKGVATIQKKSYSFAKYPEFVLDLIKNDGLINMIRKSQEVKK